VSTRVFSYMGTLKVLSSEMEPTEIRLILLGSFDRTFLKDVGVLAKFARPPSIESPLKYESA
jgi:hypothetical protein